MWVDGRRTRASEDAPWEDEGPGLDLGAYRVGQIPQEAIYRAGSLGYAVLMRKEIVDSHPNKTIDLDEGGNLVFT